MSWNSSAVLPRCLAHLQATEWPGGQVDIVVVDNGSTDGSCNDWPTRYPGIELRQTGRNLGFGAAANVGLHDLADVAAVSLVNPDAFVERGWLTPLYDALMSDQGLGATCPKLLFDNSDEQGRPVINNVGTILGPTWEFHDRGYGEVDVGQYDRPEEVWAWCGGAVLLRPTYLEQVGVFHEPLFLYAEDVDLSWRGQRQGWRYLYRPESVVRHQHRASSGGQRTPMLDYLNRRNRLVVVTRNGGWRGATAAWGRAVGGIVCSLLTDAVLPVLRREPTDLSSLGRRYRAALDAALLLAGRRPQVPGLDDGRS